jgi:hypothetical protein
MAAGCPAWCLRIRTRVFDMLSGCGDTREPLAVVPAKPVLLSIAPGFRRCILRGSVFGALRTSSMRPDMYKVIVERPRRGKRMRPLAIRFRNNLNSPVHLSMRTGYDYRELNEDLQPLRRYLHAQVGRSWDKVFSEICATIDRRNAVQQHIHQHIDQFIATRVGLRDGRLIDGEARLLLRPADAQARTARLVRELSRPTPR